jgi:hypothetical protein
VKSLNIDEIFAAYLKKYTRAVKVSFENLNAGYPQDIYLKYKAAVGWVLGHDI